METSRAESSRGLAAFSACGARWAFSFLPIAGSFVLPPALLLRWVRHRRTRIRPHAVGLVAGAAAHLLSVGLVHISDRPWPESGSLTVENIEPGFSNGGLNGVPWPAAGIALMGVSAGLFCHVRLLMRDQRIDPSG